MGQGKADGTNKGGKSSISGRSSHLRPGIPKFEVTRALVKDTFPEEYERLCAYARARSAKLRAEGVGRNEEKWRDMEAKVQEGYRVLANELSRNVSQAQGETHGSAVSASTTRQIEGSAQGDYPAEVLTGQYSLSVKQIKQNAWYAFCPAPHSQPFDYPLNSLDLTSGINTMRQPESQSAPRTFDSLTGSFGLSRWSGSR
jgi:hypothetical protein